MHSFYSVILLPELSIRPGCLKNLNFFFCKLVKMEEERIKSNRYSICVVPSEKERRYFYVNPLEDVNENGRKSYLKWLEYTRKRELPFLLKHNFISFQVY